MRILITGVHGFVGTNLVKVLKEKHTLFGLDIVSPKLDGIMHTYQWDDLFELPEVDAVIHLAGKAHDVKNTTLADEYFSVNTDLTIRIYDWFLNSAAGIFIFFSTVKAAADRVEGDFLTEDMKPKPMGPYGESKRAAEAYLLKLLPDSRKDNPKKVYILRPAMIHGPGNKGNLNLLYQLISKGIPWPLGAFENERSFCSVQNVIFIVEQILNKKPTSGIYHLADDNVLSTNQLIVLISAVLNKRVLIWKINRKMIVLLAKSRLLSWIGFDESRLQKLTETYRVSNSKIKEALGVKSLPVTAEDGMINTIKSFTK